MKRRGAQQRMHRAGQKYLEAGDVTAAHHLLISSLFSLVILSPLCFSD